MVPKVLPSKHFIPYVRILPLFFLVFVWFPKGISPSSYNTLLPLLVLVFRCFLWMTLRDFTGLCDLMEFDETWCCGVFNFLSTYTGFQGLLFHLPILHLPPKRCPISIQARPLGSKLLDWLWSFHHLNLSYQDSWSLSSSQACDADHWGLAHASAHCRKYIKIHVYTYTNTNIYGPCE